MNVKVKLVDSNSTTEEVCGFVEGVYYTKSERVTKSYTYESIKGNVKVTIREVAFNGTINYYMGEVLVPSIIVSIIDCKDVPKELAIAYLERIIYEGI